MADMPEPQPVPRGATCVVAAASPFERSPQAADASQELDAAHILSIPVPAQQPSKRLEGAFLCAKPNLVGVPHDVEQVRGVEGGRTDAEPLRPQSLDEIGGRGRRAELGIALDRRATLWRVVPAAVVSSTSSRNQPSAPVWKSRRTSSPGAGPKVRSPVSMQASSHAHTSFSKTKPPPPVFLAGATLLTIAPPARLAASWRHPQKHSWYCAGVQGLPWGVWAATDVWGTAATGS
jgi:hypothetical protein